MLLWSGILRTRCPVTASQKPTDLSALAVQMLSPPEVQSSCNTACSSGITRYYEQQRSQTLQHTRLLMPTQHAVVLISPCDAP